MAESDLGVVSIEHGPQLFVASCRGNRVEFAWSAALAGGAVLDLEDEVVGSDVRPRLVGWSSLKAYLDDSADMVILRRVDGVEVARTPAPPPIKQGLEVIPL